MRNLLNNTTIVEMVAAVNTGRKFDTTGATAAVNETAIDLKGQGRKLLLIVSVGATATSTLAFTVTSGADNSTFGTTERAETDYPTTIKEVIELTPSNRYVRIEWAASTTGVLSAHVYVDFSIMGVVFNERYRPSDVA